MSNKKSRIWSFAMPLSVVFLAAVYYIKVPEFRKAIDARTSVVHDLLGGFVQESKVIILTGEQDPAFKKGKSSPPPGPGKAIATPAPMVARAAESVKPPPAVPVAPVAPVAPVPPAHPVESAALTSTAAADLQKIVNDRTKWPKKVLLTKAATFPAVYNGKVVGTLVAPVGAEANVVQLKDDKIGLEFNGGGAWVPAAETDLLARVSGQ